MDGYVTLMSISRAMLFPNNCNLNLIVDCYDVITASFATRDKNNAFFDFNAGRSPRMTSLSFSPRPCQTRFGSGWPQPLPNKRHLPGITTNTIFFLSHVLI